MTRVDYANLDRAQLDAILSYAHAMTDYIADAEKLGGDVIFDPHRTISTLIQSRDLRDARALAKRIGSSSGGAGAS